MTTAGDWFAMVQHLQLEELDDATRAYLKQVRDQEAAICLAFTSQALLLALVGIVLGPILVVASCCSPLPHPGDPLRTAMLQTAFLLPGAWMIVAALRVFAASPEARTSVASSTPTR